MQYQIGDFSRISRLSIKTLRYYHECGLLEPINIDEESGYRLYDESCLERVQIIHELKALHFPLKDIKEILDVYKEDSELIRLAMDKSKEINEKIAEYNEMQKKLEAFIKQTKLTEEVKMHHINSDIVLKEVPDMLIASIRFEGKYQEIGPAFKKLLRHCGRFSSGVPFALYYDMDYKEEAAEIEACIPVKSRFDLEDIKFRQLQGGKALTVIHKGPYDALGESYKILIDHINENKLKVISPYREGYLRGPGMILPRSPKKFVTEIQILLDQ